MPLDEIKRADKEIIDSGYEKQAHQTNKTAMQTGAEKQFIMVETEKNDGFYKGHTSNYILVKTATPNLVENEIVSIKVESCQKNELIGENVTIL